MMRVTVSEMANGVRSSRGTAWWLSVAIIAALVIAGLYGLTAEWVRPTETIRSSKIGTSSNMSAPLVVTWGISKNVIREEEKVPLWFQFHNQSESAILDVGFAEFDAPGFTGPEQQFFDGPRTLNGGQTILATGDLIAHEAGRYNLTAVYSWKNSAGAEVRDAVSLGPIEVASDFQVWISNLFGRMAGFILPLSLALAGAGLQLLQKRYDDSRRAADDEHARAASVLNTLLPTQMEHTRMYYQPLVTRVATLRLALQSWEEKTPADRTSAKGKELADEIVFHVAMLLRQRKFMGDHLGGIHLQSRPAEKLFSVSWRLFNENLKERMPRLTMASVNKLPLKIDIDDFAQILATKQIQRGTRTYAADGVTEFAEVMNAWLRDPTQPLTLYLPLFELIRTVLGFELNRPFERWYDSKEKFKEKFPKTTLKDLKPRLGQIPDVKSKGDSGIADVQHKIDAYLKENADRPWE